MKNCCSVQFFLSFGFKIYPRYVVNVVNEKAKCDRNTFACDSYRVDR